MLLLLITARATFFLSWTISCSLQEAAPARVHSAWLPALELAGWIAPILFILKVLWVSCWHCCHCIPVPTVLVPSSQCGQRDFYGLWWNTATRGRWFLYLSDGMLYHKPWEKGWEYICSVLSWFFTWIRLFS